MVRVYARVTLYVYLYISNIPLGKEVTIVEFLGPESDESQPAGRSSRLLLTTKLKLMKCKNVKGKDGFTIGKIYNVLYAGRVYWVENDYGERICDSDESFEPV